MVGWIGVHLESYVRGVGQRLRLVVSTCWTFEFVRPRYPKSMNVYRRKWYQYLLEDGEPLQVEPLPELREWVLHHTSGVPVPFVI